MMNRLTFVVALAAAFGLYADTMSYLAPDSDVVHSWSETANWYDAGLSTPVGRVPTADDAVTFGLGSEARTVEISDGTAAVMTTLVVGDTENVTNTLRLSGGSLTPNVVTKLAKGMTLGTVAGSAGVFEMNGGNLNFTSSYDWGLRVGDRGYGKFTVTGGTLVFSGPNVQTQIGNERGSVGEAVFAGGTFPQEYKWLYLGVQNGAVGTLRVTGSTISQPKWGYQVGHLGRGILEIECNTNTFDPYQIFVGGTGGNAGSGLLRIHAGAKLATSLWSGWRDGWGLYVGNSGDGEVENAGTLQSNVIGVGGRNGAKLSLLNGSLTYAFWMLEIGRIYNGMACPGVVEMSGGRVYFSGKHTDDPATLKVGGISSASGGGILRGYGSLNPDSLGKDLPVGIGHGGRIIADGGELSLINLSRVIEICEMDRATSNGFYAVNGGRLLFPGRIQPIGGTGSATIAVGCAEGSSVPSVVHALTAKIAGAQTDATLRVALLDAAHSEVPAGCPTNDGIVNVWNARLAASDNSAASCASVGFKIRLAPTELKGTDLVAVYRSTGYGWKQVPASWDAVNNIVTIDPVAPEAGTNALGYFAVSRVKGGAVLILR